MTHCHLTLDLADCLNDNTYYDEHRRAAESDNSEQTARNYIQDKRHTRHYAQEKCANKRNLIEYLLDIERCGLGRDEYREQSRRSASGCWKPQQG